MTKLTQPTWEQCKENAELASGDGRPGLAFATVHPQWGGHGSRCIVETSRKPGACFDVTTWHDGGFPIDDESNPGEPDCTHYCDPLQLIRFGTLILAKQSGGAPLQLGTDPRRDVERAIQDLIRLLNGPELAGP